MRGGFPELYANLEIEAEGFLRSYVATYLERDLRHFLHVSSLRDYERFLRAAALRSAQLLNRADLAREVGISASTAAAWLSALEASHQLMLLEPWFANRTKALVKRPKLYLRDAGLAAFLCGVRTTGALHSSPLAGPLWETLVCSEIRRAQSNRRGAWDLHFWAGPHPRSRFPPAPRGGVSLGPRPSGPSTRTLAMPRRCARWHESCRDGGGPDDVHLLPGAQPLSDRCGRCPRQSARWAGGARELGIGFRTSAG